MHAGPSIRIPRSWTWLLGAIGLAALCGLLGLVFWMSLPPSPVVLLQTEDAAHRQARLGGMKRPTPVPSAPTDARLGRVAWHEPATAPAGGGEPLQAFVQRMAMQALVVPVLDAETQPPRWADPELTMPCFGQARVSANGRPVEPGAEQPAGAFTLHWTLEGCMPFGPEGPVFTGTVDVDVFFDDEGPSAAVRPQALQVSRGDQHATLDQPFGARMP